MTEKEKLLNLIKDYGDSKLDCGYYSGTTLDQEHEKYMYKADNIFNKITKKLNDLFADLPVNTTSGGHQGKVPIDPEIFSKNHYKISKSGVVRKTPNE